MPSWDPQAVERQGKHCLMSGILLKNSARGVHVGAVLTCMYLSYCLSTCTIFVIGTLLV